MLDKSNIWITRHLGIIDVIPTTIPATNLFNEYPEVIRAVVNRLRSEYEANRAEWDADRVKSRFVELLTLEIQIYD